MGGRREPTRTLEYSRSVRIQLEYYNLYTMSNRDTLYTMYKLLHPDLKQKYPTESNVTPNAKSSM